MNLVQWINFNESINPCSTSLFPYEYTARNNLVDSRIWTRCLRRHLQRVLKYIIEASFFNSFLIVKELIEEKESNSHQTLIKPVRQKSDKREDGDESFSWEIPILFICMMTCSDTTEDVCTRRTTLCITCRYRLNPLKAKMHDFNIYKKMSTFAAYHLCN